MFRESLKISHYEVLGKIGAGGMGSVYKARDQRLHRLVAIKLLNNQDAGRARFLQEARAASSLDHPNICTIFEIDEEEQGRPFIAMAYYSGGNLKRRLEAGPLPVAQAVGIAEQIALGLLRAHKEGIVHRDIKPANIMFSEDGVAKVVDFGIAKMGPPQSLTLPGWPLGTLHYMSPEQVESQEITHRADIWSLGVVCYEMLSGQLPFPGEENQEVFQAILLKEPVPLQQLNADVPDVLAGMVHRCLKKDSLDRYPDLQVLLEDLAHLRESFPYMPLAPLPSQSLHVAPFGNQDMPTRARPAAFTEDGPLPEELLELPEGTMDPESRFYVKRRPDLTLGKKVSSHQGLTFSIVGPRQIGKSSLLLSLRDLAVKMGRISLFVDFQIFGKAVLRDADTFYTQFCRLVCDELEIEDQVDHYWSLPLSNPLRCTRFFSRYVLRQTERPLLLAMDEVDCLIGTDYGSDFFGMLRSWHNSRRQSSPWKRLDLGLVTSTEPYFLISNHEQSPFNVGETVELEDFSLEQANDLNHRHGKPLDQKGVARLHELLGGHPYLLRKALYILTSGEYNLNRLFDQAAQETGPFGDHLRNYLYKLHGKADLIEGMLRIINGGTCDDWIGVRLKGIGLARRDQGRFKVRCRLYENYFASRLST